jgi:hypothetical protein
MMLSMLHPAQSSETLKSQLTFRSTPSFQRSCVGNPGPPLRCRAVSQHLTKRGESCESKRWKFSSSLRHKSHHRKIIRIARSQHDCPMKMTMLPSSSGRRAPRPASFFFFGPCPFLFHAPLFHRSGDRSTPPPECHHRCRRMLHPNM